MSFLPPPPGGLELVSIDSVKAALEKMDIKVPVDDIITAIREVEDAKRAEDARSLEQSADVLFKCKWLALLHVYSPLTCPIR
jgi:hypothetical protein